MTRRSRLLVLAIPLVAALAVGVPVVSRVEANAAAALPVSNSFANSFPAGFGQPTVPPPGANNGCKPNAAHPNPVILVHGTLENMNDNWRGASPLLANNGYCVFALNYGGNAPTDSVQGIGEIGASAAQLSTFVNQVLAATGAAKVDIVGHSQGGLMPRAYIKNLGGAAKVGKLVGITPSNNGTTLSGLTTLGQQLGVLAQVNQLLTGVAPALPEQEIGSPFLTALNAGGETVPGVTYTVIATNNDEVVTPFQNSFLPAAANVTNITVQNQCAQDMTDHLEAPYDPITLTDMLNALDPAHPQPVKCVPVRPVLGP
ncbi:MAG TPA: alpha/beta fold hydrolase [Rugosimonospora sp.]|nr:alpha/beta fold hydrolase [Rugosimonospora sp.]